MDQFSIVMMFKIGAKDSMSLIRYPDLKFGRILAVG